MAGLLIALTSEARVDAIHVTRLRKVPTHLRAVLAKMANGYPVGLEDARNAVFAAAFASVSAKGTSMARREDAEACQRLWRFVQAEAGINVDEIDGHEPLGLNLSNLEEVEAWLTS